MSIGLPVFFFQGNRYLKRNQYGRAAKVLWFSSSLERQHLKKLLETAQTATILNYETDLIKRGLGADIQLNRMLLDFYSSKGDFEASSNVFNRLSYNATVVDTSAWMNSFFISGESARALNTLRSLFENKYPVSSEIIMSFLESTPDVELCNDLLRILRTFSFKMDVNMYHAFLQVYANDLQRSEILIKEMYRQVRINTDTYAILIRTCMNTNNQQAAWKYYEEALTRRLIGRELFGQALALTISSKNVRSTLKVLDDMMVHSGSTVNQRFLDFLDIKSGKPIRGSLRAMSGLISDFIEPSFVGEGIPDALCFLATFHFELHDILRCLRTLGDVTPSAIGISALERLMKGHHIPHVTRTTIEWGEEYWLHLRENSRINSPTFEQTWTSTLSRLCFQLGDTSRATELLDTCFSEVNDFAVEVPLATAIINMFFQDLEHPTTFAAVRSRCVDVMETVQNWELQDQAVFLGCLLTHAEKLLTPHLSIPHHLLNSLRNDLCLEILTHIQTKVNLRPLLRLKPVLKPPVSTQKEGATSKKKPRKQKK